MSMVAAAARLLARFCGSAWLLTIFSVALATLNGCDEPRPDLPLPAGPTRGDGGQEASTEGGSTPSPECAIASPAPAAPGGYYVNGNTICTADGRPHLFHGVFRQSLEWAIFGEKLSLEDFQRMASWGANVVRIALNQDFWLTGARQYDSRYAPRVDEVVGWAEQAGLDVILELHWSDRGTLGSCSSACQQLMADTNSVRFWSEVATRYQNDGRVAFELYNEPYGISWDIWLHGGETHQGWRAAGMQDLYDAVRATGANNLVIAGGLDWGYELSGVPSNPIDGYNVLYATHPYSHFPEKMPSSWQSSWGFLADTHPVIVTEFGDIVACSSDFSQQVIDFADSRHVSWTAWPWFAGMSGCRDLIADWSGTPTALGELVRKALLGYQNPPVPGSADAGADARADAPGDTGTDADGGVAKLVAQSISAGADHTCAALADGTVECWGYNAYGQLGNGSTMDSSVPVPVTGITNAVGVAAGWHHTCALLGDGTVECWGYDAYGQLGNGSAINSSTPVPVVGITDAVGIAAGWYHTCAVLGDGTVECWGWNGFGQLGSGNTTNNPVPVPVNAISSAVAVAAGGGHTCALGGNGTIECWGNNSFGPTGAPGQLGDGTTTDSPVPVAVAGITNGVAIATGAMHTCAALGEGTLRCWGDNTFGELGDGGSTHSPLPVTVSGITDAVTVTSGWGHTCALLGDGTVKCWGYNLYGELGNGGSALGPVPVVVSGITNVTALASGSGSAHTCAVLSGGSAKCWGYNGIGQLGHDSPAYSSAPLTVRGF
jgi:alpha-tubulin suppressor-like RCC1 family protein